MINFYPKNPFENTYRSRMPLTSDFVFRMVFGSDTDASRSALMGLLNIVLGRGDDPITAIQIKNPIDAGQTENEKEIIMDIKAQTGAGELLDIEMQSGHLPFYITRTVYYGSRLVSSSLQPGENYDKLKKSIVVSFIDGILFPDLTGCHNVFQFRAEEKSALLTDDVSLHFIELGKINPERPVRSLTPVERLAAYLKYASDESRTDYIEEILSEQEELTMAEKIFRELTQSEIAYEKQEARWKFQLDMNTRLARAEKAGEMKGKVEGKAEGRIEGKAEGEALFAALTSKLLAEGRLDDLQRAAEDSAYRSTLFEEYGLSREI